MSDEQLNERIDRELQGLGHAARAEIERDLDVEAALRHVTADAASGAPVVPTTPSAPSAATSWRWLPLAAAAVAVAFVVGAGWLFLGGDEQIATDTAPVASSTSSTVPVEQTIPTVPVIDAPPTTPAPDQTATTQAAEATTTVAPGTTAVPSTTPTTSAPTTTGAPPTTPEAVPPRTISSLDQVPYERYLPDAACLEDACAQVVYDPTGAPWTFADGALTQHIRGGASVTLPSPWNTTNPHDIWLLAVGPDDVAYFQVWMGDENVDLVGISVATTDIGEQVVHEPGVLDFSGDTDYVAAASGLVAVGCCGPEPVRPDPAAQTFPWLDRADRGQPVAAIEYEPSTTTIRHDPMSWTFDVDQQRLMVRGMPKIVATHDGGVIAALPDLEFGTFIVRGWPDGTTSVASTSLPVTTVTPSGYVVIAQDEEFVVADFFADGPAPEFLPGTVDVEAGTMTLDDGFPPPTNTGIGAALHRANAIAGPSELNETRTMRLVPGDDLVVAVTTENYFDDSVYGTRITIDFTAQSIGWANTCQPGRGHQDYQPALCA